MATRYSWCGTEVFGFSVEGSVLRLSVFVCDMSLRYHLLDITCSQIFVSMYLQIAYSRTQQQQHKHCYLEIVCLRLEVVQTLCSLLECLRVHCYRLFVAE